MKSKIILSDCDGVLLDWRTGFLEWLPDHISDTLQVGALEHENFNNAFDYDQRHIDELAHEFNRSEAISRLNPWHDSVEYVKKLGELGFRFHICTAMGSNELSQQYREYNLFTLYGDLFDTVQLLPVGASKAAWLQQYEDSEYFWLEDHAGHAQDGDALGLKSVIVTDSSNSQHTDVNLPRTSEQTPWRDIYEMVLADYQL